MLAIRAVTAADLETVAGIVRSSYRLYDPDASMPGRHPTAVNGSPFSWFGDSALSWWLALLDERPAGFATWRHHERDVHLHSFFVASEAQRRGVGSALIRFHVEQQGDRRIPLFSTMFGAQLTPYTRIGGAPKPPKPWLVQEKVPSTPSP